ncbi:Ketoreductase CTB6 [Hyphodiscus hymeniophilus]|uniref:Ketoreductase CTB6 n=1 Tax=Hyphodiscus hymeniophilus TaxID=353542 RepID=A0A9P6SKR7_9HELO|nr:Ketoreductase CTB6 [Hyphodiscus hymeniophilus]
MKCGVAATAGPECPLLSAIVRLDGRAGISHQIIGSESMIFTEAASSTIMAGELVLITGVSGHVGFRVLATALAAGYQVRATVRKQEQIDAITATKSIKQLVNKLEIVVVPDILKDGAFDGVVKDVSYIIHVASPLAKETDNPERDIIEPAIKATINILESAHKVPDVKRIVITSSMAVITAGRPEEPNRVYTEADVVPRPSPPYGAMMQAYANSKTLAYYATLDWIKENKPAFDVINLQPSFVIGANELNTSVKDMVQGSNALVLAPLLGSAQSAEGGPKTGFSTVHVDDVAYAHVKALDPSVRGNQSFLIAVPKQTGSFNDVIEIATKQFPGIGTKFPLKGSTPSKVVLNDSSKAERELGITFKPFEEQVKSLVGHLLELKDAETATSNI